MPKWAIIFIVKDNIGQWKNCFAEINPRLATLAHQVFVIYQNLEFTEIQKIKEVYPDWNWIQTDPDLSTYEIWNRYQYLWGGFKIFWEERPVVVGLSDFRLFDSYLSQIPIPILIPGHIITSAKGSDGKSFSKADKKTVVRKIRHQTLYFCVFDRVLAEKVEESWWNLFLEGQEVIVLSQPYWLTSC